jgi:diguanylate cyclase (GGDEF)-like protein
LNILDTLPEERFDRLTRLAKRLFGVPIALVSLVDENRQWFKSCQGLAVSETDRDISFCGHAITGDNVFLIPDASQDERFHDNPLVTNAPHIRFYAGCPLKVSNGSQVGTLCIIDREPRAFSDEDIGLLKDLTRMVEEELTAIQLATMDELTMLSNRRGFEALAQHALSLCLRLHKPASLLFFDLDLFKQINDQFGHPEGDRALIDFAGLLQRTFRESDVVGRIGGDEFAVMLTNCPKQQLDKTLQRFQQQLDFHNETSSRGYQILYSVGVVHFDVERHGNSLSDLMAEADALMYERKKRKHDHGRVDLDLTQQQSLG